MYVLREPLNMESAIKCRSIISIIALRYMELSYHQEGDYLIPNIEANEEPEESLTKYGMLRETFLKEHHEGIYTGKLLSGKLTEHCLMIQKQAEERFERLKIR